jgi:NAD(P)-dependent dehydrogenase (short-subunit alcohol dehydrogenase family)
MTMLRRGLLGDRAIALSGEVPGEIADALATLGARLEPLDPGLDEERANGWAGEAAPLHGLVYCASGAFRAGGVAGLDAALEQAWVAVRAVATGAMIPAGGGKLVLIGPPPDAGPLAGAARAGLENLARTLSVEWARHSITAAAVAPGPGTTTAELAELVCFLVSPAGDYLSGCVFELGGLGGTTES